MQVNSFDTQNQYQVPGVFISGGLQERLFWHSKYIILGAQKQWTGLVQHKD